MAHKHRCNVCGLEAWRKKSEPCFNASCPGTMRLVHKPVSHEPRPCPVCKAMFVPRNTREMACPGPCQKAYRREKDRERAARRYHSMSEAEKVAARQNRPYRNQKPWAWLVKVTDDNGCSHGRRTILHTLEELTDAYAWPWPDVLAGGAGYLDKPARGMRGM